MTDSPVGNGKSLRMMVALALSVAGAAAILWWAWVGCIGSDDLEYYAAGRALSISPWNAPTNFGGMRTAVTLPIAVSLRVFGDHEWALVLPTVLYALATVVVSLLAMARFIPISAAVVSTLLFVSLPVTAITSTIASADVAELFWAVCAFWLAVEATRGEGLRQNRLMVLTGMCIALAFAARETSAAMIVWLGVGFLFGFGLPRWKYFWSALGFLGLMVVECAYFAIAFGDPFARFSTLSGTRSVASRLPAPPFTFDDTGTLRVYDLIDPVLMLFTKHSFGALYWILLAVALFAWFGRKGGEDRRNPPPISVSPVLPALALGLIWTAFNAVALIKLRIHARYYITPTYFFLVAASLWWVGRFGMSGRRWVTVIAITTLALVNALGIWLDNRNPRFAERALADMATRYDEPIHTDGATAYIASTFLRWNGGGPGRIVSTPPAAGELSFRVLSGIGEGNRKRTASVVGDERGEVLESRALPPLVTGTLAAQVKASTVIPTAIRSKLTSSRSSAELIRVGDRKP